MTDHDMFLELAISEAKKSVLAHQAPFGAVITHKNQVVVATHNQVWQMMDPSAHAEIEAIRLACLKRQTLDLSGHVLYSSCEPCPMCFCAIHWARLDAVYFAAPMDCAISAGFHELAIPSTTLKTLGESTTEIFGPLSETRGKIPFDLFLADPHRKVY